MLLTGRRQISPARIVSIGFGPAKEIPSTYSGQIQLVLPVKLVLVGSWVPPDLVLKTGAAGG